jgi:hypothetical protein
MTPPAGCSRDIAVADVMLPIGWTDGAPEWIV